MNRAALMGDCAGRRARMTPSDFRAVVEMAGC